MADYVPSEEVQAVIQSKNSTIQELKDRLMQRALDGKSRHTPEQMELLILWRLSANNITPADRAVLDEVNETLMANQPRAVLMLNTFARHAEMEQQAQGGEALPRTRYRDSTVMPPCAPPPSLQ